MIPEKSIIEYSDTLRNYVMIDGLTPTKIKQKYIWLLNAIVRDAIIGEDDYGLVWYTGDWIAGEWEDGTWYSGIWYDGEWKNGKFYSYYFDRRQLLQRNKVILEKNNPVYSEFRHGIWRRGEFYNGYFGPEQYNEEWEFITLVEKAYYGVRWERGTFHNGVFRNSSWLKGTFKNGIFYNSVWIGNSESTFINGTFQGYEWYDGVFTGGDFVLGLWHNGKFNQSNPKIKSRFGSMPYTGNTMTVTTTTWYNGEFFNGEFHSGLNIVSGITMASDNHNRSVWVNGTWWNGLWYGGTHINGDFNNGFWLEGLWSGGTFNNGYWKNGFWLDGIINGGFLENGLFVNVVVNGGEIGYQAPDYLKDKFLSMTGTTIPNYLNGLPTVTTDLVSEVTTTTMVITGNVLSDGGEIVTAKGVCWSTTPYPVITKDNYTISSYGTGAFSSYIYGLSPATYYYVRTFATNVVGTDYGNRILVTTL